MQPESKRVRGKKPLAIKIDKSALEQACKNIIETILFYIPNAYKGTVYRIGKPPEMIAKRITSGVIDKDGETISWGLPEKSGYNPPGKPWLEYRDEPGRPSEAMAWCVERQRSWTAEDPQHDSRSVRLQVEGVWEDFHHMEPVLIRKEDLYLGNQQPLDYPRDYNGEILWQDSDYVVVAVIKIHFRPRKISIGGPETRIIKRLSRTLGTELLSYQLKQQSLDVMRQLAADRLNACNILADSLRNAITKSGLIFSLIKLELQFLREQWEKALLLGSDQKEMRRDAVYALNKTLKEIDEASSEAGKGLAHIHNKFLSLYLPPERGENWVRMQIEDRWNELLCRRPLGGEKEDEIRNQIGQLKKSLYLGQDPCILSAYNNMSEPLKSEWTELIYRNTESIDFQFLDRLIHILEDSSLDLPYQRKSRKSLIRLKALAEIIGQLEDNTNIVLRQVLNGNGKGEHSIDSSQKTA